MKQLLAMVVCLGLMCGTAQAQTAPFFDESFEYASNAAWRDASSWVSPSCTAAEMPGILEISTDRAYSGTRSLKYTYTGINPLKTCSMSRFYPARTEIWTRERLFLTTFFSQFPPTKHIFQGQGTTAQPTGGYPNGWSSIGHADNQWGIGWQGTGAIATDATIFVGTLPSNRWVCIEVHLKMNTPDKPDGVVQTYVDGQIRNNNTAFLMRRSSVTINSTNYNTSTADFRFTQVYRQHGTGVLYVDDYAVGSTRIGCTGTPPPVDTIPPTPPTSLTANAATSTLTWTAGSDSGGSGYAGVQVFRCVRNPSDCTPTVRLTTVSAPATSYQDASAAAGITYDYRLKSYDGEGNVSVDYTAEVSLTPPTTNRRVLFSDTFIRADNADIGTEYDGGYPTGNSFKIASNKLAPTVGAARNFETYNVAVPNDQFGSILASDTVTANDNVYVLLRVPAPAGAGSWDGYECGILDTTSGRLQRIDNETGTVLGTSTISPAFAIGDRIRGEAQGTAIRCYIVRTNAQGIQTESLFASATDATYASGRVGLRIAPDALPSVRIAEFLVGDFTSAVDSTITHDATWTSALGNITNSLTWVHTVGTASNRILTACLQTRHSGSSVTVSNVTANGVSLAKFRDDTRTNGTLNLHTSLWRLIAPSSGANTLVATFSAAPSSYAVGSSSSFSGVEQVAPIDAVGGSTGSGTAVSLPLTSTVTGTLAVDCVVGSDTFTAVGASQTILRNSVTNAAADGLGVSRKGLAASGAATTSWTQSVASDWAGSVLAMKPAQVVSLQRPMVLTATMTATGATSVTYGSTTPTALRVVHGPNSGIGVQEVVLPIASVPGGAITRTWSAGDEFVQIFAMDAFGITNGKDGEYAARTLIGIAPPASVTAVAMSNPQPSTALPAGTTSANISMTIDQPTSTRECRWADTNVAYSSMTNQMTVFSTFASAIKTGLQNGQSYTVYRTCVVTDGGGTVLSESAARSASTFTVASSTADVTPPATVTNLVCAASGTQADCTHTVATDAVSYEAYLSSDAGVTYALAATPTSTSFSLMALYPKQTYSIKVLARDVVGNPSAAYSNVSTVLMPSLTDITPPSAMVILSTTAFAESVLLHYAQGTDDSGSVTYTLLYCSGADCTPGTLSATVSRTEHLLTGLTASTLYRFTGFLTDGAGNESVARPAIVEVTTMSAGLRTPRALAQFGVTRPTATRSSSGTRLTR